LLFWALLPKGCQRKEAQENNKEEGSCHGY